MISVPARRNPSLTGPKAAASVLIEQNIPCGTVRESRAWARVVSPVELTDISTDSHYEVRHANLVRFASLLFNRMSGKYGGATTLNELVMLNYGFLCHSRGEAISVTIAAETLGMPKSTVSRILTGMRSKGFVTEQVDPTDRRRRIFKLKKTYLCKGNDDIKRFLEWCAKPENALV